MISVITVSSRGQIVIPKNVRKKLGIKEGSKLVLLEKERSIIVTREEEVSINLQESGKKEEIGWMGLAEESLKEIWKNSKDEKAWSKYL